VRVASVLLGVLGVAAMFTIASPLYSDGVLERGSWGVTTAVLVVAGVLGTTGGALQGILARTRFAWVPICALVMSSVIALYPFLFFVGRFSAGVDEPLASWLPVTVSGAWLLYLMCNYVVYRLVLRLWSHRASSTIRLPQT
jgi:hypothetical protein